MVDAPPFTSKQCRILEVSRMTECQQCQNTKPRDQFRGRSVICRKCRDSTPPPNPPKWMTR